MLIGKKNKKALSHTNKSKKNRFHFAWEKLIFKKKSSFISRKIDEIEILDYEEPTKFKTKKKTKNNLLNIVKKNKLRFATSLVGSLAVLIFILSLVTGTNVIKVGAKKFLEGLGVYTEEVKKIFWFL